MSVTFTVRQLTSKEKVADERLRINQTQPVTGMFIVYGLNFNASVTQTGWNKFCDINSYWAHWAFLQDELLINFVFLPWHMFWFESSADKKMLWNVVRTIPSLPILIWGGNCISLRILMPSDAYFFHSWVRDLKYLLAVNNFVHVNFHGHRKDTLKYFYYLWRFLRK